MTHDEVLKTTEQIDAITAEEIFSSPGIPAIRKVGTGIFLSLVALFTLTVALDQGANVWVSTFIAVVFIGGFIYYLSIVAPTPYQILLYADRLERLEAGQDPISIPWSDLVKVKEERFPNKLSVSIALYKRVGEKGLHRAYIVYRDDLPLFEAFILALHARITAATNWKIEITHE